MLIQIHMLQNYAPSNLNRDDTGSPKDAVFGGVRRGRISSQCLKRSIRHSTAFVEAFKGDGLLASRTKRLPELIRAELEALGVAKGDVAAIVQRVPEIGRESAKGSGAKAEGEEVETKQLIFVAPNEIRPMAEKLLEIYRREGTGWAKAKIENITKELGASVPLSVDVAMFGRMTTSAAFQNIEAAVQVAHALSTNALAQEFDYYTAVDDLSGESGAGMIGDIEFNSSTYYKYVNVHWEGLLANLGGDAELCSQAVLALLVAAATAQPSGKQNTFAAQNLPDFVLVEVRRENLPVSYANAFMQPVRAGYGQDTLMTMSIKALCEYRDRLHRMYDLDDAPRAICSLGVDLAGLPEEASLGALKAWLAAQLPA